MIENGSKVSIEYILSLKDGTTVATNVGKVPLVYEHGQSQILPALERVLVGLKVNDMKKVALSPEEGYGVVDPKAFVEVKPQDIPEGARKAGATLVVTDPGGHQLMVRVHEVHKDKIVLDLNHPLAGKALTFDVRIIAIE